MIYRVVLKRFKARTLLYTSMIRDLLFADDAALIVTSLKEAKEL